MMRCCYDKNIFNDIVRTVLDSESRSECTLSGDIEYLERHRKCLVSCDANGTQHNTLNSAIAKIVSKEI